jgi:pilus assembly protein FimV
LKLEHQKWRKSSLALATGVLLCAWNLSATALSLGQMNVQSALGEPLRAEIDILDINVDESASLKAVVATHETFASSGLEYNAVLSTLKITLQQRPNGRAYLSLSSTRAINDPYLDLILEASWASGRIMRDYTLLFDPPSLAIAPSIAPVVSPVVSTQPVIAPQTPAPSVVTEPDPAPQEAASTMPAPSPKQEEHKAPENTPKPKALAESENGKKTSDAKVVTVRQGDTAAQIALANKPTQVSLEQMLVAMLANNPSSFVNNNVNRLRSGSVLNLPDEAQALSVPADQAQQTVIAQGKDFNAFRAQLAAIAPAEQTHAAGRLATGSISAAVIEKKPEATVPDKLTLSKGDVKSSTSADQIAKDLARQDAVKQSKSVAKNIDQLEKLSQATAPKSAPAATKVPEPIEANKPASNNEAVVAPTVALSPPVQSQPAEAKALVVADTANADADLIDELLDNPMMPVAAGMLMVLLAGLGFYRFNRRRKGGHDSSYLASQLQPDSFFDASGGKRVDTNDSSLNGSSMVYSPSQLDAADDVDPIAEADVYLAYGRDLQAEEILKEALHTQSNRVAIHLKLCEIYAKRRDPQSLESIAQIAMNLTQKAGPEWAQICELGKALDTANPLYQPSTAQSAQGFNTAASASYTANTRHSATSSTSEFDPALPRAAAIDLDLDLDFAVDAPAPTQRAPQASDHQNTDRPAVQPDISPPSSAVEPEQFPASYGAAAQTSKLMEFDLGSLSLDLNAAPDQPLINQDDPMATKLALAEEFRAIGNVEGARELIHEILANASGDMKSKAQNVLSRLG